MAPDEYGDAFLAKSKYKRGQLPRHALDFSKKPPDYMVMKSVLERVPLDRNATLPAINMQDVLEARVSRRGFSREPIDTAMLSCLLKFTTGVRGNRFLDDRFNFRHVPSAGGLYPHETYVVINNVERVQQGIYHYNVPSHSIDKIRDGDFKSEITGVCLDQPMAGECAAVFCWVAIPGRSKWKYLQRAYRYIYMDLGHVAQNFYLVAEALGLAACTIGALYDDEGNALLGLDGLEEALAYVGIVGRRMERQ